MIENFAEQATNLAERLGKAYLDEAASEVFYHDSPLTLALSSLKSLAIAANNKRQYIIFNSGDSFIGVRDRRNYDVSSPPTHVLPPDSPLVLSGHANRPNTVNFVERFQVGDSNFLVRGMRVAQALNSGGFLYIATSEQAQDLRSQTAWFVGELFA